MFGSTKTMCLPDSVNKHWWKKCSLSRGQRSWKQGYFQLKRGGKIRWARVGVFWGRWWKLGAKMRPAAGYLADGAWAAVAMGTHPSRRFYRFILKVFGAAENHLENSNRGPSFSKLFGFCVENKDSESGCVERGKKYNGLSQGQWFLNSGPQVSNICDCWGPCKNVGLYTTSTESETPARGRH